MYNFFLFYFIFLEMFRKWGENVIHMRLHECLTFIIVYTSYTFNILLVMAHKKKKNLIF